jgi:uncharacterized metal-binding protein
MTPPSLIQIRVLRPIPASNRRMKKFPLVYSCSGCSSAAQMANHLAIRLDREYLAEMSCIAGVGGNVPGLVKTAQSGRPILALDGCVLACVRNSLARAGVSPSAHLILSEFGVRKRRHADFDATEAGNIYEKHVVPAAHILEAGDKAEAS